MDMVCYVDSTVVGLKFERTTGITESKQKAYVTWRVELLNIHTFSIKVLSRHFFPRMLLGPCIFAAQDKNISNSSAAVLVS
jgi:hypothetical protein